MLKHKKKITIFKRQYREQQHGYVIYKFAFDQFYTTRRNLDIARTNRLTLAAVFIDGT